MNTPRRVIYFFTIGVLLFLAGSYYSSPGRPAQDVFVIEPGESANSVVERLVETGLVRSRIIFLWELRNSGQATKLQPGEHYLGGVVSYRQIIERLASGNLTSPEATLLIREGETLREIKTALEANDLAAAVELYEVTGEPAKFPSGSVTAGHLTALQEKYSWLATVPKNANLEGFLFPDTYRVYRTATAEEIVNKLLDNFDRKLTADVESAITASGHTLYEIVIMASILEREVRSEEDRRLVADLFWRRLDIGMRLQADSTVNYVIEGKRPALTQTDTQLDSPYNTYRHGGLPPGPISNPGLISIKAAANPQSNSYWYFLTDTDGNVHYARNLEEHNRNKAAYLR